jgi:hypothetical protein
MTEGAALDEFVAYFAGVKTPFNSQYVPTYRFANKDVLAAWLIS